MGHNFKAGDAVVWVRYGTLRRGTIVEQPRGSIAIIREHGSWNRTWAHLSSLELAHD